MSKTVDVTIDLQPMTVTIETDAPNEEDLLKKTKVALIEKIEEQFDMLSKTVVDRDALSMETVTAGQLVSVTTQDKGKEYGFITAVNKKTVDVAMSDGTILNAPAHFFQRVDVEDVTPFVWGRPLAARQADTWYEGNAAYLKTDEGTFPVVFGKTRSNKFRVYVINGGGRYFTLTPEQLKFVTETK